ncbi:MAG: phosphatidylglycerophosphatase A [Pseudomonadales bacterium]|nr:phosphatidylglycerophosphatase A [Pseudomonadales bacterium]
MKNKTKKTFTNLWYFLALGFGSGLSRWAPGTMGSLAAVPLYFALNQLDAWLYALLVLMAFLTGVWFCGKVAEDMQVKDPGSIVWDEFVGLWITLFMLPEGWYWVLFGFVTFRIFDIWKPWPIGWFDKNLSGGLGIMVDDVIAGLCSLGIIQLVAYSMGFL